MSNETWEDPPGVIVEITQGGSVVVGSRSDERKDPVAGGGFGREEIGVACGKWGVGI